MSTTLAQSVAEAGYYPALANHVLNSSIGDEVVRAHFVHAETTFDTAEVRRHMSVLVLTDTRLLHMHVDDGSVPLSGGEPAAQAIVEAAPLSTVNSVTLTHVVHHPERFVAGDVPQELVLAVGWGVRSHIDLEVGSCPDETCEADHGYQGALTGSDALARASSIADGEAAVRALEDFAKALNQAVGRTA